ncbi:MAG: cobalt ECF transporter T component CbiQ [Lachnospiraceae bacterium]|nr:cobalt ECF transporter T component CbiQ [Lachnospiraceae bacterium]
MSGIEKQLREIDKLNTLQQRDQWMNRRHPLVKLCLTVVYIIFVVSCHKYQLSTMVMLAVYPFMMFNFADLSLKDAIYRMRLILPIVMAVGIFNPFMDREVVMELGNITLTGGVISMITLMLKGLYAVLSAYLLIATTTIEDICFALRRLHMPKILVTVILLIDRYIYILGQEAERIMTAYQLRAPSQKGIHYKAWGPLVGQWLIRSMERAQVVYESMTLRGYRGEFSYGKKRKLTAPDFLLLTVWLVAFVVIRKGF